MRWTRLLLLCATPWLTGMLCPLLAHAQGVTQEEGAIVFGQQRKLPPVGIEPPQASLDFVGRFSRDVVNSSTAPDSRSTDYLLQETLSLRTRGYLMHPNLVDLHLSGTFGLTQEWFHSNQSRSTQDNNYLYTWDNSATILRNEKAPLTLYTQRSQSFIDRSFGPTIESTETTYGASLNIQSSSVPTDFRVYHREETQSGIGGTEDYSLKENVFQWHSQAKLSANQSLTGDYTYSQAERDSATGISDTDENNSASLAHSLLFGANNRSALNSSLGYVNSTGLLGLERLSWDEHLRIQHTDNLETDHEYRLEQQSVEDVDQLLQRATSGFRHRLYRSLVTSGRVGWQDVSVTGGSDTQDLFGNLNFSYQKRVPYGRLISDVGADYDYQINSARSAPITVLDQRFSFVDFQPFNVSQQNVIPTSVVIQDAVTSRIFTPDIDYSVQPVPGGFQLNRIVGGSIFENEPLLLRYRLGASPASEISTLGFGAGVRYQIDKGLLRGLGPYVRYRQVDQNVHGGGGTIVPTDSRDYIAGIDYHLGDLYLRAEREVFDSTIFPFDANRFEARWSRRVLPDTTFSAQFLYSMLDYIDQHNQSNTARVTASIAQRLSSRWKLVVSGAWIDVDDKLGGHTIGFEESLELRWRYRQMEAYARVRNSSLDSQNQDRNFQFVEIGIRREF